MVCLTAPSRKTAEISECQAMAGAIASIRGSRCGGDELDAAAVAAALHADARVAGRVEVRPRAAGRASR